MTRTARVAAGVGGVLVAAALGVTVAAATGEATAPTARTVAATLVPTSSDPTGRGEVASRAAGAGGETDRAQGGTGQAGAMASWAAALGVDEATLRSALAAARADARAQRTSPSGAAPAKGAFFAALATRLGKPESQIRSTFGAFLSAHQAGSREALAARLDAAVAAGRIGAAERTAILKAYDARLLGRGTGASGTDQAGGARSGGRT